MSRQLPLLPNIDHLRLQAKTLLDRCCIGDLNALSQVCGHFPEFRVQGISEIASSVRLHHAQDVIATQYGFSRWSQMCETVEASRRAAAGLSAAMEDSRMLDLDYRAEVAQRKGLPAIGTSKVSAHGIRYEVVDFLPAVSQAGAARVRSGGGAVHISDLLPVISFPEMSERLYELYIETDTVTSRPILFFDTLPDMHPHMAAKGMHQVISPAQGETHCFHFDASDAHETFIAHELGHIWVEMVEQKEDFRHPKDLSDLTKAMQFYHIQSFVMDLCVNDLLARRGFDMSVIASDQARTIVNFADNVANKRTMKGKRVLAGVINALAGTLIEMERFPDAWSETIKAALKVIETGLPEAFEPAKAFVRSVMRHGYANSDAIRQVVDDCARISFTVTGESYDPELDLVTVEHTEPTWDKRPGFLTGVPSHAKQDVFRAAAARGITGTAKYNVFLHGEDGSISVTDPAGVVSEPVRIAFRLPYTPVSRPRPAAPAPLPNRHHGMSSIPVTIAHTIPGNGFPPTPQSHGLGGFQSFADADPYSGMPGQLTSRRRTCQNPDPFQEERARIDKLNAEFTRRLEEQQNRISQQNEQIQREQEERQQRIREQNEMLSRTRSESYDGKDLQPCLTPAAEEHARLRQQPGEAIPPGRNYMGRVGLWLSQVGWEQRAAGEQEYGYGYNDPVSQVDPAGLFPGLGIIANGLHNTACINRSISKNCAGISASYGGNPVGLLPVMYCIVSGEGGFYEPGKQTLITDKNSNIKKVWGQHACGAFQIIDLYNGVYCAGKGYPNWKSRTDSCDNLGCGVAMMCDCLKDNNGQVEDCSDLYNAITRPRNAFKNCLQKNGNRVYAW